MNPAGTKEPSGSPGVARKSCEHLEKVNKIETPLTSDHCWMEFMVTVYPRSPGESDGRMTIKRVEPFTNTYPITKAELKKNYGTGRGPAETMSQPAVP